MQTPSTPRVLIVDDDPVYRMLLKEILRRAGGFDVSGEAADGAEALRLVDEDPPDVVLLDLMMPGMDGFEALPLLRKELPQAYILVLTALDESEAAGEGVLVGMDAFLEKRHAGDRLVGLLRAACT